MVHLLEVGLDRLVAVDLDAHRQAVPLEVDGDGRAARALIAQRIVGRDHDVGDRAVAVLAELPQLVLDVVQWGGKGRLKLPFLLMLGTGKPRRPLEGVWCGHVRYRTL